MRIDLSSKKHVRINRWHRWFAWYPVNTIEGKRVWLETVWASCLDLRGWPSWTYSCDMTEKDAIADNKESDEVGAW